MTEDKEKTQNKLIRELKKSQKRISELEQDVTWQKQTHKVLQEKIKEFQALFNNTHEGFALCQVIQDEEDKPVDYQFIMINAAFGVQSGMSVTDSLGKTIKEIYPDIEPSWIEKYGNVGITGKPIQFQDYNHNTNKWYDVSAFSPSDGKFAMLFKDVSELRLAERNNMRMIGQ